MAGRSAERSPEGSHVLAAAACGVDGFIRGFGADPDLVLGEAGLDHRLLEDSKAALPLARYVATLEQAARRTFDDEFGLWFGQQFRPEDLGLIGQLALAAPDIATGLAAFARHFVLHQQNTETRLAQPPGHHGSLTMATDSEDKILAEDTATLHKMGYAQELARRMSGFSNFAVAFSII